MYQFSESVLQILRQSNWSNERKIDSTLYKAYYLETKQTTSNTIYEFLGSFGDLTIKFPLHEYPNTFHSITINPIVGGRELGIYKLNYYIEHWIKKPLCVIGHFDHYDTCLMTPNGEIYSVFDKHVCKYGESIIESIENICTWTNFEVISQT